METIEIYSKGNGLTTLVTAKEKEIKPITGISIIIEPNQDVICKIDVIKGEIKDGRRSSNPN